MESLAARLRSFRERKRLTKYRLAKLSGVSQTYIYRIEQGEIQNPRRDTLQALAQGLSITLAELIGETSPQDTWGLVELSLRAYIPIYSEVGEEMSAIDYVVCTRATIPPETLRGYRNANLFLEPEIRPGDTIIVDSALVPADGDVVVVVQAGQSALKRYRSPKAGQPWLEDNEGRCDIASVSIHGVVTEFVHRLR